MLQHERKLLRDDSGTQYLPVEWTWGGERVGMRGVPRLLGETTAGSRAGPSSCFVSLPFSLLLGATQASGSGDRNGSLVMLLNNPVPEKSAGLIISRYLFNASL